MVRQFKIHSDMDNPTSNEVWDVTNGLLRLYEPSNLGIDLNHNLFNTDGIGILGARTITQPNIEFKLETFGKNLEENYKLLSDFVNCILSAKYVTLEYSTEWFQVFADVALSSVTKTEGFGRNGTFSEKIVFEMVTKWYTFEELTLRTLENGEIISGVSKIYGGQAPAGNYKYVEGQAYTYYGETDIGRLSRWDINEPFFSFVARLTPVKNLAPNQQYGLQFLNENGNQYTAILFTLEQAPNLIEINTDVNDEFYQSIIAGTPVNIFPNMDFQAYRTRIFEKGQMVMKNLRQVDIRVKRKVDFI